VDRQRKIEKIANQSGRVSKVGNLEVHTNSIHPDYALEHCDGILSETGKLELLKLVPKSGTGPSFTARWDQKPQRLDIDMHDASTTAAKKFKAEQDGYSGHHTERTSDPHKRVFDVTITVPTGTVFDGSVSFSNTYEEIIRLQGTSRVTATANVIRANPKPDSG